MPKSPVITPSQTRSRETKERILSSALELFNVHGFTSVTTKMIAEKAEVSIGSLYVYFQDKRAIAKAVLAQYSQPFLDVDYASIVHSGEDIVTALERILLELRELTRSWNLHFNEMQLFEAQDPELQAFSDSYTKKILDMSHDLIKSSGLPLRCPDSEKAAAYVFLTIESFLFRWHCYRNIADIDAMPHEIAVGLGAYLFGPDVVDSTGKT